MTGVQTCALPIFLAAIGLYSVASYAVAQRTKEFGVRVALGAQRGEILRIALLSEGKVVLLGVATGAGLSLLFQNLLGNLMNSPPQAGWLLAPACLIMLFVSAISSFFPARRAARAEPLAALRSE